MDIFGWLDEKAAHVLLIGLTFSVGLEIQRLRKQVAAVGRMVGKLLDKFPDADED